MKQGARVLLPVLACALSLGALAYHAHGYRGFFIDDSFISLRYSERLLHGLGLTWTDGERVEGYSNFLWVVLVAGAGALVSDLVHAAQSVGAVSSALAVVALVLVAWRRARNAGASLGGLYAGLAFAASGPLAAWTMGGLEQPLLVGLLCWGYALVVLEIERDGQGETLRTSVPLLASATLLGATCLVRPDGFLFALAAAFGVVVAAGLGAANLRRAAVLLVVPGLFFGAHTLLRKLYYDAWVPNTYHAKGAFSWQRVLGGWTYVRETLVPLGGLYAVIAVALVLAIFHREARRRLAVPLVAALGWTVYVVRIGGDICPQHRHLTVTFALACFMLAQLCGLAWERSSRVARVLAVLAGPLVVASLVVAQREDPARARALSDNWHWSGRPVGRMMATAFAKQRPLFAVDAAGALPFYYQLPSLDMLGLCDRYIAEHPPAGIGKGYTGHELGDGKYVLSRKPDLIAFWTPIGSERPQWRSGHEMLRQPSFRTLYQAVTFQADARTRARLWVRRIDGRIGMQATPERVTVPGFLLDAGRETPVVLRGHKLSLTLAPGQSARVRDVPIAAGTWALAFTGTGAPEVRVVGSDPAVLAPGDVLTWSSGMKHASLRVTAPADAPVTVEQLTLVRRAP